MSVTYVSLSLSRNRKLGANDVDEQVVQHKLPAHMYVCVCMYVVCRFVCICEKYIFCATAEMTHSVSFPDLLFCSSLAPLRRFTALVPSEHPMLNNIGLYTNQKKCSSSSGQHTTREEIHMWSTAHLESSLQSPRTSRDALLGFCDVLSV